MELAANKRGAHVHAMDPRPNGVLVQATWCGYLLGVHRKRWRRYSGQASTVTCARCLAAMAASAQHTSTRRTLAAAR